MTRAAVAYPAAQNSRLRDLTWIIYASYYALIFSIPFGVIPIGSIGSVSSLAGYIFVLSTALRPKLCYGRLDKSLWAFGAYAAVFLVWGMWAIFEIHGDADQFYALRINFQTFVQLLILFWVSTNLLTDEIAAKHAIAAFTAGSIALALVQALGLGGTGEADGRSAALGANPNLIGALLMFGLIMLMGLAYGQIRLGRFSRFVFWIFGGLLFMAIIRTGSRGAVLSLIGGLGAFLVQRASLSRRFKLWMILLVSLVFLVMASLQIPSVRERWERSLVKGDTAGRDKIYGYALAMVREKPFIGWAPLYHHIELGERLSYGKPRDFHNLYLHVLTQAGMMGGFPFFLGLGFCGYSAWKARKTCQGILPLALIISTLLDGMSGTPMYNRSLWFILAYGAASGVYPVIRQQAPYWKRAQGVRRTVRPTLSAVRPY